MLWFKQKNWSNCLLLVIIILLQQCSIEPLEMQVRHGGVSLQVRHGGFHCKLDIGRFHCKLDMGGFMWRTDNTPLSFLTSIVGSDLLEWGIENSFNRFPFHFHCCFWHLPFVNCFYFVVNLLFMFIFGNKLKCMRLSDSGQQPLLLRIQ